MDFAQRDAILQAAVDYTSNLKGKTRDREIFTYLCGAVAGYNVTTGNTEYLPPWLWILGIRGGSRLAEIERMLHASE